MKAIPTTLAAGVALAVSGSALAWTLEQAAEPYRGTTIKAIFLDRPGYAAAQQLIPEFEERTGITVTWETLPYENSRERQVLDFVGGGDIDVVLVDVVWIGEFAANGWITPMEQFYADPELADPDLDLDDFFPVLLDSFGTWDDVIYGLPFDNYSGLLFYNQCQLEEAGFDGPPATWNQLLEEYGPVLTDPGNNRYAFALQSRRGETQSADSFMRVLWPFGGGLLDEEFRSDLLSEESQYGLQFRQELMAYMPPGIVDYDHAEAVDALAQGQVAMITEWSAFYPTLNDPDQSRITDCLRVAPEPEGPAGLKPALGGFSLAINSQSDAASQAASWLFIQWITSKEMARPYVEAGGVSGRMGVYEDEDLKAQYPYIEPMVQSWEADTAVPDFRPRFPEWPAISEIIALHGTRIMLGEVSPEEGARIIGNEVERMLDESGYYTGDRPLLK